MNEGCAPTCHYRIMTRLHEQGRITDGNFLEFLQSHTNVVFQPEFDDPRFSRLQPLCARFRHDAGHRADRAPRPRTRTASGFRTSPAAATLWRVLRDVWANYRDESFISQFLSPRLMRQLRMFHLHDDPAEPPASWSMPSTTSAATAACAASCRGSTTSASSIPISRWSTSISPATAG